MMDNINELSAIHKKFGSTSSTSRTEALESLFNRMYGKLKSFFFYWTQNREDADDLVQVTFLKLLKIWGDNRINEATIPNLYVRKTANSVLYDFWRKSKNKPILSLDELLRSEIPRFEDVMLDEESQNTTKIIFHISRQSDRYLATLRVLFNITPKKYSILTGIDINTVRNSMRRVKREAKAIRDQQHMYLTKPHPWQKKLQFTNDEQPISVAYVNVNPHNFHPDCWHEIKKDLDISSMHELRHQFIAMIRTEGIDPYSPLLFLTFVPRKFFTRAVFREGKQITYASYQIAFINEKIYSKKDDYLVLFDKVEFPGRVTGNYNRENNRWYEFEYQFPTLNMLSRKAFNVQLINYQYNPYSREPTFYAYRNYPLDPKLPFPLPLAG
jgi:RNA polymerase sigma factor (sigma-70 family)